QIKHYKPDVVFIHDLQIITDNFLKYIRPFTKLIVGQSGSPSLPTINLSLIDIMFTLLDHLVDYYRKFGIAAYLQHLAFDQRILEKIKSIKKKYPITFIGACRDTFYEKRSKLFDIISKKFTIDHWGPGSFGSLNYQGEAWGLDMFSLLHQSEITLNCHIDAAKNYAANMRLYEATGCGTLLITDHKDNLNEIFEIGNEIISYRSPEECADLIKYYLEHAEERKRIAKSGQKRTLKDHTYTNRMKKTAKILERHLRYQREKGIYFNIDLSDISKRCKLIQPDQISKEMVQAWKSKKIPMKQRSLVQKSLSKMYQGEISETEKALFKSLYYYVYPFCPLLEIGCSSGYYYEILEYLFKMKINYSGVDYSESMIKMATDYYPGIPFYVADGSLLPFKDRQFLIVISSCILLHVPNFKEHIKETVRISERFVVSHRTPICKKYSTRYIKKIAYGIETVEIIFNENEIIESFLFNGLKLLSRYQYFADPKYDEYEITYVFERL
ncbi:Methyltransferase type 11 domain protein, partial [Candidatus Magnetomorum sp. HK-1]